jgi:membrane fusion protein (multidrug efflux system)
VKLGQKLRLTVEGDTNVYSGKISRVAPAIREIDRMLSVEADVPNPGTLRAALFARAKIILTETEPGLTIPENALTTFAGIKKVVVIKDSKAIETPVTTGRRGPGWIEVVSGVNERDLIALDPVGLRTGQAVTIMTETRAPEPTRELGTAALP